MATILCFRISDRPSDAYQENYDDLKVFEGEHNAPYWDPSTDAVTLTRTLNQQVKHQAGLFNQLADDCVEHRLPLDRCDKFDEIGVSYIDIFHRDALAFRSDNTSDLYAVVALYNNVYYGHVYLWLSEGQGTTFMMGIRNRVDSVFIRGTADERRSIALLLLEGARRFALINGTYSLIIIDPFSVMIDIAEPLGFVEVIVPSELVGSGVVVRPDEFSDGGIYSGYRLDNLRTPFVSLGSETLSGLRFVLVN